MPYLIILLPLVAGGLAQIIKLFIKSNHARFDWKSLLAYSGMPSGHSAIVVSLAAIMGLIEGFDSPLFALAFVLAIIVIRDAVGIRQYLGQHGKVLNALVKDLKEDWVLNETYPHLLEQIGHTPAQVIAGSLLGLVVSLAGYWLLT